MSSGTDFGQLSTILLCSAVTEMWLEVRVLTLNRKDKKLISCNLVQFLSILPFSKYNIN